MEYLDFLRSKIKLSVDSGMAIDKSDVSSFLKPHQADMVVWAVTGGRRALFESFGLGKTLQQLEICRILTSKSGGKALIVCPLGVKQEFRKDAAKFYGMEIPYVRNQAECKAAKESILITNYERVRDGDIDPKYFTVTSLDEASVLRSYGSLTYQTFLDKFRGVKYKYVCTATPSPNKFKELIHYAGYLEIMDTGQALTRFFKRDSTKANNLTLHPHKEQEFYLWLNSWAVFLTKPSDLGYSDDGYDLPGLRIHYHCIDADHNTAGVDEDGQVKMFRNAALSLKDASKEKRDSLPGRINKMVELISSEQDRHCIIWHDLEAERHAIKKALPESVEVFGTQDLDVREQRIIDFSEGKFKYLATKPEISGQGCNFQYYCSKAIFLGIGYKFNDFIQAIHRIYRFQQSEECDIHIIYSESEAEILKALKEKWANHEKLVAQMTDIIKENGLNLINAKDQLMRTIGVNRIVEKGQMYEAIQNDCVIETMSMEDNSIDLIHTSIPFSNHYEYTPTYNDFGHTDDNDHFFAQMDFLTPQLLRILRPGRVAAIHVKDRILFGNTTGDGMPTLDPFSDLTVMHFIKHGFRYMGRITIETDVVRENNQTYRLGWSEQCKDGSKMGVGCPEYLLLFRKLPSDTSRAYADLPVVKSKQEYTRGQWQIDARAKWNASGDRFMTNDEIKALPIDKINRYFKEYMEDVVYDYQKHVDMANALDEDGKLPATFQTLDIPSRSFFVWDDVNRMLTLNTSQSQKKLNMHICLAKGSLILTRNGYKEIEQLAIGDMVLTHKGSWKPVIGKKCTGINPCVQTKAQGVANLITTPTHKIWTRKTEKKRAKDYMKNTEPQWIEAKEIKGGWVNLKLPEVEESTLSAAEWWIVGRYLADGHIGVRGDFYISVGRHKVEEFEAHAKQYLGATSDREAIQYRLKNISCDLKKMLLKCGKRAENKQVPIEGICLDVEKSESLLAGYLSGDGCIAGNATMASSVSRGLLLGMAMVAQRAKGVIASVYKSKPSGKHAIQGRVVNQQQLWVMSWRVSSRHQYGEILNDGAWKKVDNVLSVEDQETWSIQVADDASYTAEGCIVKNCPLQFDIVDRVINRFSNKGELVFDPFGGLMTVPFRAIKLGRRGMATELNPESFRDGLFYLRKAEIEAKTPTLFDALEIV